MLTNVPKTQAQARRKGLMLGSLAVAILLICAIAVIYVSHLNRRTFAQYQTLINERDDLETEWGQLLLEESALAAYARIEAMATQRLAMRVPKASEIVMVRE